MKRKILILSVLAILLAILAANTLAYFTADTKAHNVITSGGVAVQEVDPRTMASKKCPGLYFAGEVLDVDAYTGGYNLQIAWCTAQAAARGLA